MLLAIDAGNTNTSFAVINNEEVICKFTVMTRVERTADEFGYQICGMLEAKGIVIKEITDIIISSVVPGIMNNLTEGLRAYLNVKPMIIGMGIKTGIRIITANPKEIGADRIVDAVAAHELYGGDIMVIDFGTATTYDLVSAKGEYVTGITAPGIGICAHALWNETANLPEVAIKKPDTIIAQDTITSMQAGLIYGYIGQTEYIIKQVKKEAKLTSMKVIATGGFGKLIADETDMIDCYDPELTIKGLQLIYQKNTSGR